MSTFFEYLATGSGIELWEVVALCIVSFLGSFITAAFGLGGGTLNLATMALIFSPAILIPIHGVVQLGSNFGRAILMHKSVNIEIIPLFILGTIIGALVGGNLVVELPTHALQMVLAVFILYSVWAPDFLANRLSKISFLTVGVFGAIITMFVGATGPVITPFVIATSKGRKQVVGTHAALMSIQHTFKILVFGFIGFSFIQYIPIILVLTILGLLGTFAGKQTLNWISEGIFSVLLRVILTVMALKLAVGSIF
ncbi:MAG: sulfite exporter TauE/SafE family protein [Rhodospirillales bacterium]|tara:strand:+ start:872 stop:1633 length:762 start_codon:yes stop_codon:yes gene_type:complete